MATALEIARQGRGAAVFEAGIGKSRLVSELASNAAQHRVGCYEAVQFPEPGWRVVRNAGSPGWAR